MIPIQIFEQVLVAFNETKLHYNKTDSINTQFAVDNNTQCGICMAVNELYKGEYFDDDTDLYVAVTAVVRRAANKLKIKYERGLLAERIRDCNNIGQIRESIYIRIKVLEQIIKDYKTK